MNDLTSSIKKTLKNYFICPFMSSINLTLCKFKVVLEILGFDKVTLILLIIQNVNSCLLSNQTNLTSLSLNKNVFKFFLLQLRY